MVGNGSVVMWEWERGAFILDLTQETIVVSLEPYTVDVSGVPRITKGTIREDSGRFWTP